MIPGLSGELVASISLRAAIGWIRSPERVFTAHYYAVVVLAGVPAGTI